jgi:peroxiredoxin
MTISVGDTLPEATFKTPGQQGPEDITIDDIFADKKVVLFGVPGAFTPTCHQNHFPGFLKNADKLKEKGVDTIAVVAVNDVFVMGAWSEKNGGGDKILHLSDGNGDFVKALDLTFDGSAFGLGTRSKRFAMLVEDKKVKILNVEDSPGDAKLSTAEKLLEQIS